MERLFRTEAQIDWHLEEVTKGCMDRYWPHCPLGIYGQCHGHAEHHGLWSEEMVELDCTSPEEVHTGREVRKQLHPAKPQRLNRLPQIYEEGVQVRSVVSSVGAPTSQLSKHLAGMLSPFVAHSQHRRFHRVCRTSDSVWVGLEDLLVNFDVVFLFPRVLTRES